jgi:hypothetical protein
MMPAQDLPKRWPCIPLYRVRAVSAIPLACVEGLIDRESGLRKRKAVSVGDGILHHHRIDHVCDLIGVLVRHFARQEMASHLKREDVLQFGYGQAVSARKVVDAFPGLMLIATTEGGKHRLKVGDSTTTQGAPPPPMRVTPNYKLCGMGSG